MKERVLYSLIEKHFEKVDFSDSIDRNMTMRNYLYKEYQTVFELPSIKKHLAKVTLLDSKAKFMEDMRRDR